MPASAPRFSHPPRRPRLSLVPSRIGCQDDSLGIIGVVGDRRPQLVQRGLKPGDLRTALANLSRHLRPNIGHPGDGQLVEVVSERVTSKPQAAHEAADLLLRFSGLVRQSSTILMHHT